jgi:hypothetical protein
MLIKNVNRTENIVIKSFDTILKDDNINASNPKQRWVKLRKPFIVPTLKGDKLVKNIWVNGNAKVNKIIFNCGNSYKMTNNHKLMKTNGSWCKSSDLQVGDEIKTDSGTPKTIVFIERGKEILPTFDIEVQDVHHYFLDNGIVSHNSSVIQNTTNGLLPPRTPIQIKTSKMGAIKMVVPGFNKYRHKYTFAFDMKSNKGITDIYSVIQKWNDQAISANFYYDPKQYENNSVPLDVLADDILRFSMYGGKCLYYSNVLDGKTDNFEEQLKEKLSKENVVNEPEDNGCSGGGCVL